MKMAVNLCSFLLSVIIICCNAEYGWLIEKSNVKGKKVLINTHDHMVELVFDTKLNVWQRTTSSNSETDFVSVHNEDRIRHREDIYFRDMVKNKNMMAIFMSDIDNEHKALLTWIYKNDNDKQLQLGLDFAKKNEKDEALFDHYMTKKEAVAQCGGGCPDESNQAITNEWTGGGGRKYGWLEPNDCQTALKANVDGWEESKKRIVMRSKVPEHWEYYLDTYDYEHLTNHFFRNKDARRNVQIMYDDSTQKVLIEDKESVEGRTFAKGQGTEAEYDQYIKNQLSQPPPEYTQQQYEPVNCGIIALNNFCGYKQFDYGKEKKLWKQLCENEYGPKKMMISIKKRIQMKANVDDCVNKKFGKEGLSVRGFEHLLGRAGWQSERVELSEQGIFEDDLKSYEANTDILGLIFSFFKYGGYGPGHYVAIRRFYDDKGNTLWRKIDGAAWAQTVKKKQIDKITKKYTIDSKSMVINDHDKKVSETLTTDGLIKYIEEKLNENAAAQRDYSEILQKYEGSKTKGQKKKEKKMAQTGKYTADKNEPLNPNGRTPALIKIMRKGAKTEQKAMMEEYSNNLDEEDMVYENTYDYDHSLLDIVYSMLFMDIAGFIALIYCLLMFIGCIYGWYLSEYSKTIDYETENI